MIRSQPCTDAETQFCLGANKYGKLDCYFQPMVYCPFEKFDNSTEGDERVTSSMASNISSDVDSLSPSESTENSSKDLSLSDDYPSQNENEEFNVSRDNDGYAQVEYALEEEDIDRDDGENNDNDSDSDNDDADIAEQEALHISQEEMRYAPEGVANTSRTNNFITPGSMAGSLQSFNVKTLSSDAIQANGRPSFSSNQTMVHLSIVSNGTIIRDAQPADSNAPKILSSSTQGSLHLVQNQTDEVHLSVLLA